MTSLTHADPAERSRVRRLLYRDWRPTRLGRLASPSPVHLVAVPPAGRAAILRAYVTVATSGRHHLPVAVGAPDSEFQAIAGRYPVYRIDPAAVEGRA